jgi:hypothetical protein
MQSHMLALNIDEYSIYSWRMLDINGEEISGAPRS